MTAATAVRERGITFSAPMIQALLARRKTMTRRIIKTKGGVCFGRDGIVLDVHGLKPIICPYGKPGDRLYARETFWLDERNRKDRVPREVIYDASPEWAMNHIGKLERVRFLGGELVSPEEARRSVDGNRFWHKKPSIHMPRWASRITLEITEVREQQLQEISEEDARAEGISILPLQSADDPSAWWQSAPGIHQDRTARGSFIQLWDSIHGTEHPWASNPWVFAISFRRIER